MNNESFLIEDNDLERAKDICKYIDAPDVRNRAVADATAATIAAKYFQEYETDTASGLHNICQVLTDIEISDIYINGAYIDVRLYFNENELSVPKAHFDQNLLPLAYMFIKLDEDLSSGVVTGFLLPENVNTSIEYNGYYKVNEQDLISFYDVESRITSPYINDLPEGFESDIFDYLDGKLEDKSNFYRTLLSSREGREKLLNAAKVQNIFNFVKITEPESAIEADDTQEMDFDLAEPETIDFDEVPELDLDTDIEPLAESDSLLTEFTEAEELEIEDIGFPGSINEAQELEPAEDITPLTSEEDNAEGLIQESLNEELTSESPDSDSNISEIIEESPDSDSNISEIIEESPNLQDIAEPLPEVSDELENLQEGFEPLPEISEETEDFTEEIQEYTEIHQEDEIPGEFSTNVTPSIESIGDIEDFSDIENLENLLEETDKAQKEIESQVTEDENNPQIDTLFNNEEDEAVEEALEETFAPAKPKSSKLIPILGIAVIIAVGGYLGYTKFFNNTMPNNELPDNSQTLVTPNSAEPVENQQQEAMPVETVENIAKPELNNEGTAVSIPAIEQNLDASILVSNLSVNWEVPSGYVTNNTAKRYFTKMGKIIQLNLKTELLLLNKPPITNKIALELEFNKNTNKFDIKGITASSGEESVDKLIRQTVKNALDINLNMNMNTFNNLQGNPVLIIRL